MDSVTAEKEVILEVRDLTKNFGGLVAVNNLSIKVYKGEIVGIIGPNGAGKTTLFNLITGFHAITHGKVLYHNHDVSGLSPERLAKMGIVRTFQKDTVFRDMTVLENMLVAYHLQAKTSVMGELVENRSVKNRTEEIRDKAVKLLTSLGMGYMSNSPAAALSHGFQRLLGLAIAMAAKPSVLLLDEPVSGLSKAEIDNMMRAITSVHEAGATILLIEHNVRAIMNCCDRVMVMNFGAKVTEGKPREIAADPKVVEIYLGAEDAA